MEPNTIQDTDFVVGDRVTLTDRTYAGVTQVGATVLEIRYILGKQTYVIETDDGKRKVVGASQVSKLEE